MSRMDWSKECTVLGPNQLCTSQVQNLENQSASDSIDTAMSQTCWLWDRCPPWNAQQSQPVNCLQTAFLCVFCSFLPNVVAQRRALDVFSSVCLLVCVCVCQHDNFRTSKRRIMKLGGKCIVQTSQPSSNLGALAHWVRRPSSLFLCLYYLKWW